MTSLLTEVLGEGPSAVATALIPDLHHFRGSFGGAHVIPLWRDDEGTEANITVGVLAVLEAAYGSKVTAEDLFAFCYAVLATPEYVRHFWEELRTPGPRIPIPKNKEHFITMTELGRQMLWLHTFAERFVPDSKKPGKIPAGRARMKVGTPTSKEKYPTTFSYDAKAQELHIGEGVFEQVRPEVWEFSVSGLQVVASWLGYRMKKRAGKSSSPLDAIRPDTWQFDDELLELLWVLDSTVDILPKVAQTLKAILTDTLFVSADFPIPTTKERDGPQLKKVRTGELTLGLDDDDEENEGEAE